MIKFKDVAHLYLGCKLQTKEGIGTFNVLYTPGNVKPHTAVLIGCYDLVKSDWRFDTKLKISVLIDFSDC